MTETAIVSIDNATKVFAGRPALRGVSLSVTAGEMVALIGPSGAGKSTLLRAINGFVTLDQGSRVEAFGDVVQGGGGVVRGARRLRSRIAFVFQQFNLVGRLSLSSNVLLGSLGRISFARGLLGLWPAEARAAAAAALERMGIADHGPQRARTLSGGQQQRAAIARALVQGARLVLADEPVASLDPASSARVMEALRELNRRDGLTVIVSLHQVALARRWCDRIVGLKDGVVTYDGPAAGLDEAGLAAIYGPSSFSEERGVGARGEAM